MRLGKIIVLSETQMSWDRYNKQSLLDEQKEELKHYSPTTKQIMELFGHLTLAAETQGIITEFILIEEVERTISKLRHSCTKDTIVWTISDGSIFHKSSAINNWLRAVGVKTFGIDTKIQAITDNKYLMSVIASHHGISVPQTYLYRGKSQLAELPGAGNRATYFVKPNTLGSQVGITESSRVSSISAAKDLCEDIYSNYHVDSIVQAYVEGNDYRVSYIETKENMGEFFCIKYGVYDKNGVKMPFSSNKSKSGRTWKRTALTKNDDKIIPVIIEMLSTFNKLGFIQDYSGLDIRGSEDGGFLFLENNVKPFPSDGCFKPLAEKLGFSDIGYMYLSGLKRAFLR